MFSNATIFLLISIHSFTYTDGTVFNLARTSLNLDSERHGVKVAQQGAQDICILLSAFAAMNLLLNK